MNFIKSLFALFVFLILELIVFIFNLITKKIVRINNKNSKAVFIDSPKIFNYKIDTKTFIIERFIIAIGFSFIFGNFIINLLLTALAIILSKYLCKFEGKYSFKIDKNLEFQALAFLFQILILEFF